MQKLGTHPTDKFIHFWGFLGAIASVALTLSVLAPAFGDSLFPEPVSRSASTGVAG